MTSRFRPYDNKIPSGLYRISNSAGSDHLETMELLRSIQARGDHGVHAVVLTPDDKGLYLVCGNGAKLTTPAATSPVPGIWGGDHLLLRMPDGRGFMRDVLASGGIIDRVSPDGKDFEVFSSGFRKLFDAALNRDGELFTYDADMECDFNTSWYRPTRINHVVSGSEFGWRNGTGKRPGFYCDNLPAVVDIGPGLPTGTTFGYGAKFPARYQNALFVLDWTWGKLHAVHLEPDGSTDKAVAKNLCHQLKALHGKSDSRALAVTWPHLGHADRFVRWVASTAIEHVPTEQWADRALTEKDAAAPTQEEQIEYARSLRMLTTGWTTATRIAYFEWFLKSANFRGGLSFSTFIEFTRTTSSPPSLPGNAPRSPQSSTKTPPRAARSKISALFSPVAPSSLGCSTNSPWRLNAG